MTHDIINFNKYLLKIIDTKLLIFLFILSSLFISCGKIDTSSYYDQPSKTLRNYSALEITDFISYNPEIPEDIKTVLPRIIEDRLLSSNLGFQTIKYGSINDISSNDTLVMLAELKDITSSKDFKFEKGSLQFGESSLSLQMALVQKDTGEEVLSGEIVGFDSTGMFGGKSDSEKMLEHIANEVVNMIAANY